MLKPPTGIVSKLNVFLSYRSVEARLADLLKTHLIQDFIGLVEVFLASDTTSVPAGSRWLAELIEGLQRAQFHIIICSNYSVSRPWINYEAGATGVRGIPIVPLCHSGLQPHQLPVPLSESQGGVITDPGALRKLYTSLAGFIGSTVPSVDFEKYAESFKELETELARLAEREESCARSGSDATGQSVPEVIKNPRVLCVTSQQFTELGYANQLQIVLDAFPKTIVHQIVLTSVDLRRVLLENTVDIVHVAAFVCPRRGDLYFSSVELPLGRSNSKDVDRITADAFVALLEKAQTRLVVLGGSASQVLAAELLPVVNVIAARDMVSAKAMANWVETFYQSLMREPMAKASELASRVSQAPMKLYFQQRQTPSIRFNSA